MTVNNIQITDASDEKSNVAVSSVALTAANFDAQATAASGMAGAINALSIGSLTKRSQVQSNLDTPDIPVDPYAQRELKWLVKYQGNTLGKSYSLEIACPDLTDNIVPGTDVADITSTDWAAFITAFEAFARAPDNIAEAVTFISARLVGRNI